jgi:hypothetical protein
MLFTRASSRAANGTSLQGSMNVSYSRLVEVFGKPHSKGDGYKVDAEWCLRFDDGVIATIYNYKNGPNYNDGVGSVEDIRDWHVGGKSSRAYTNVIEILQV